MLKKNSSIKKRYTTLTIYKYSSCQISPICGYAGGVI